MNQLMQNRDIYGGSLFFQRLNGDYIGPGHSRIFEFECNDEIGIFISLL